MPEFERLLRDWFADTRESPTRVQARNRWWFGPDTDRDRQLARDWGATCAQAQAGALDPWAHTASGRLALILLTDQLPRNLFRGTAAAFASDKKALTLSLDGQAASQDQELSLIERVFFAMPMQHAEDRSVQAQSVAYFDALAVTDPERAKLWESFASSARRHRAIIERFGRFPHRNQVLGRTSSAEEVAWLAEGGERFGQ
ncbi:MAG: DUF924 domain-containing protein [Xanthomonadales bacterium]|nr:DUF924 domain-containing protein [Xanthomonadales bacterium]